MKKQIRNLTPLELFKRNLKQLKKGLPIGISVETDGVMVFTEGTLKNGKTASFMSVLTKEIQKEIEEDNDIS